MGIFTKKRYLLAMFFTAGLFLTAGCMPTKPADFSTSENAAESADTASAEEAPADSASSDSTAAENASAPAETTVEKAAGVGVTHKANWEDSSEVPMSIVTVPLATYFKAQEMAVFNMQIPSAMNLYQAETGEFPKSEEEFMTQIIKKNQIILPALPEGDTYFYDVPSHTLMVRAKQKAQ